MPKARLKLVIPASAVSHGQIYCVMQVYEPGKGLDFHFDKDESLMKKHNVMKHPYLSSVLYLTGNHSDLPLGTFCLLTAVDCARNNVGFRYKNNFSLSLATNMYSKSRTCFSRQYCMPL